MTHPLTEEQLETLEIARIEHPLNDLRIYDEIISRELPSINDDIRAGADWQLEQCIDWLVSLDRTHYTHLARLMRKEMRPQGIVQSDQPNKEDNQ